MRHTAATPSPGRDPSRGLLARLRDRAAGGSERGAVMIEVLVFMGVIALTGAMYLSTSLVAGDVQRRNEGRDVAVQQARDTLEKFKSLPWAKVGHNPAQPYYDTRSWCNDHPAETVTHHASTYSDPDLRSARTGTINGYIYRQCIHITWSPETVAAGTPADAGGYGTKVISARMGYRPIGETGWREAGVYSIRRTATPAEAAPPAVGGTP